jgi:hypothetical protein
MVKHSICPCCGAIKELEESVIDSNAAGLYCQPCGDFLSTHIIPLSTPICRLDADDAFNGLTDVEKNYAYWIGKASAFQYFYLNIL